MENTDEKLEDCALDNSAEQVVEQMDEMVEHEQEPESAVTSAPEDDPTLDVIRRFPKLCGRIAEIMKEHAENRALELIAKGLDYDEAVANADKEGYLRGKNEKIELVKNHRMPQRENIASGNDEVEDYETAKAVRGMFPRYRKKSVWENE